eukprot:UN04338
MDVGSCWWLQLIFIVAFNVVTYGIMEFWRHFPFICIFLFSTITIIEIPFVITSDNYPIHKEKFFIVTPLLTFITFWRIAYIPLVKVKSKWQAGLIKFARGCGKYLCCMRDNFEETKVVNTTLCMELFLWFITWINIIMVVVKGVKNGDIVNSICGVVLSFTLPIPAKLLYKSNSWYVRVGKAEVVYERRKSDAEKKVDEEIKMQAVNKDEDIDLL